MGGTLTGKVAVVTGGNSGIGEATVRRLAGDGAAVAMLARRQERGQAVEQAVRDGGGEACFVACDVTRRADIEAAVAGTVARYGGLHVVVNNAGGVVGGHAIDRPNDASWEATLRLNLTSAYLMAQVAWPHLVAAGGGSIVNVSSVAATCALSPALQALIPGLIPPPGYWVAKAGLEALTRYLASMGAPHGIRCNAVRPGPILTPMVTPSDPERHFQEALFNVVQLMPGAGRPPDVAEAICFFASDQSRFITGDVLSVDGGAAFKL